MVTGLLTATGKSAWNSLDSISALCSPYWLTKRFPAPPDKLVTWITTWKYNNSKHIELLLWVSIILSSADMNSCKLHNNPKVSNIDINDKDEETEARYRLGTLPKVISWINGGTKTFWNTLLRDDWHTKSSRYLIYYNFMCLEVCIPCETIITLKAIKLAITSKSFLCPLCFALFFLLP